MSRFSLLGAIEALTSDGMRRRLRAGTTVADSVGNALAGDVVSSGLCASPNIRMVALDAAAVTAFAAVGITASINQMHDLAVSERAIGTKLGIVA
jgi:hypothetical protein